MKNKYLQCALVVILVLAVVVGLVACLGPEPVVVETQAVSNRPLTPYMAYYYAENAADTWVILVDLSDRTNYPHVHTNKVILKSLHYAGDLGAAKRWHWNVGVVTAVTTVTTDIEWITGGERTTATEFDERWELPEHGLSLMVVGGTLDRVATFETVSTAVVTSSTEISTTVGVTGTVGVGDLILFMDEITNTTELHFGITTGYDTE